jgi:hypothetical protein
MRRKKKQFHPFQNKSVEKIKEAATDMEQGGADSPLADSGRAVQVVGGQRPVLVLDKVEDLEREMSFLLLPVHTQHCLAVPVTAERSNAVSNVK